ncbi:MAG TPA: SgcJ/EcaC family oxidoreductase [Kineosporiaceae bacterium]
MRRSTLTIAGAMLGAAVLAGPLVYEANATPVVHRAAPRTTQTAARMPSEAEIARLFSLWNAALATGNPQKVADRYAPDAVLLPTVSNQVRTDRAGIVDYFTHFLTNKPKGKIKKSIVKILSPTAAIDSGLYVFTLTTNGKQRMVQARYTFVYEKHGKTWLIVNHHSSVLPEPVAAASRPSIG